MDERNAPSAIPTVLEAVNAARVAQELRTAREAYLAAPTDVVEMPSHYTQLPVECIDVTEHFNFTLGNAIKYIWRADHKGNPLEDLKKARWYIDREIARRERE